MKPSPVKSELKTARGQVVSKTTDRRGASMMGFDPLPPGRLRWFFVGRVGCGKSVFCASVPNACILDFENKMQFVPRLADGSEIVSLPSWSDYSEKIDELVEKGAGKGSGFETVIFDVVESLIDTIQIDLTEVFERRGKLDNLPIADITKMGDRGSGWEVVYKQFKNALNRLSRAGYGLGFTSHMQPTYIQKNTREGTITEASWKYAAPPKSVAIISSLCDFSGFFERVVQPGRVEVPHVVMQNGQKVKKAKTVVEHKATYWLRLIPPDPRMESRQPVPAVNDSIEMPLGYGWDAFVEEYENSCEAYRQYLQSMEL